MIEALEPRVLFSADMFGGAVDIASTDDPTANLLDEAAAAFDLSKAGVDQILDQTTAVSNDPAAGEVGVEPVTLAASDSATIESPRHELVVVDAATPDYQQLVDDIISQSETERTLEVVLLDSQRDGITQLSEILSGYSDLDAVHLVSHGDAGEIHIGNGSLDLAALGAQADRVATLAASFSEQADLLIYGCDLASTAEGEQFVQTLAQLTGADVAASDDLTGNVEQGGDWDLEVQTGHIETAAFVNPHIQHAWSGVLSTTASFQEGVNGYSGTQDTYLDDGNTTTNYGNDIELSVDGNAAHTLIRFDNLFGAGPGQIPLGSTIISASLEFDVVDAASSNANIGLYRMLTGWTESSTWNSMGNGIQTNGVEASAVADAWVPDAGEKNSMTLSGLESTLQAWSDGATNYGWAMTSDHTNLWAARSSEDSTSTLRPKLTVEFQVNTEFLYLDGVGNGSDVPVADLKTTAPTDTTLDNFDPGRDALTGLTLAKGGSDINETDSTKYQLWVDTTAGKSLDGQVTLNLWSAVKDFNTFKGASITAYLVDSNASGSSISEITSVTVNRSDWDTANSGTWVEDNISFGNVNYDLANDRYLGVKIIVNGSSEDDMWFAYDATDYQSSLSISVPVSDTTPPTQTNNTGSTVAEGGTDTITSAELQYNDDYQPSGSLSYTVTTAPTNGQLELSTGPGVAITSFTQEDIYKNRLRYVHNGSNTTSDSFDFTVDDGQGNTLAGQSFALTITAVDDDAPTQSNNTGSTIAEGGTDTLINSELLYTDSEQPATAVAYTVTSVPANGQLELTTGPGVAVTSFTQDDINNNRLVYVHDGSNTTSDSFDFTVNDGQGNTLGAQSFALTITAVDDNAPTQSNNTGSTIAEGGTDTLINSELLYTDSEQPATAVAYTVTSVPANGQLELTTGPGVAVTSFTQDDINNNRLVYVHDGSNTTSDSFDFTVNDGQGNTLEGQSFALTITAVDDDAPTQSNNTGSTLAEGGTDTLISTELLYTDSEQPATAVAYTVTSVPANGQLELTTGPGVAVTSFTQDDINNNRLVYVHDGSNTTSDSFDFTVNDGQGNTLAGQSFALTITAVDDNAPTQSNNTGSTLAEGGTDTLINSELLYTDSEQPATAVAYTVTSVPANGQLELTTGPGVAITSFTQDDINNNRLVYVHDGSNTTADSFDFTVNDGLGNTLGAQSFALTITAVDDNAPTQSNNTGSTVAEGGTDTLINSELLYTDSEQPATAVAYTVTSVPANGQLELTTGPGVAITSFTQDDINNNRLVYVHDGSNTTADSFDFTVNDGLGNTLGAQSFALTITAVDDNAPTQSNNTGSTVAEGGTDTLINSELLYTDSEQPATAVAYTVTSVPANGQLELTTGPGVAVTSFTQDDINNNRLVYVHDGSNTTSDSFDFTVNDGQGNTLGAQSFALTITAVDDNAPTQSNNTGSTIAEGGTDTLINSELLYTDSEQPATAVAYTVTSVPANGQLELTTGPGVAVTSFTQDDINNNRLVYVHDGSNTTSDSFDFTVNDGQGNTLGAQSFALTITAVDDNAPTQSNNTGSTLAEGGTDTLINSELLYTDSEQPATAVAYTVTSVPANGQLELTTGPGVAVTSFTQDDINNNRLVYVHDGSNTTSDSFDFTVNDGQGNTLGAQSFALTITAVDDNAPTQSNNTGSTLAEGGTDTLISTELLYTDSEQPATAVAYTVTSIPANGQLELTTGPGVAITSFTQDDINNNRLVYVHDGSNTTSDSFDFTVNDGQGNTLGAQSFALTITAVDDNAPTQNNNTGSIIAEGGTDTLISTELLYTDSEQPATAVAYTVTSVPANGQLELTTGPGVAITSFTQDDINNNRLVYVHDGSNTTADSFDFTVNDGQGNTLAGQSFALTITAVDDNVPTQSNNTGSIIAEGGTDTLINSELLYTDSEQPATSVAYTVTSVPANGQLELTTGPGVAVTSFTQDDINNNRLRYVHDGSNTTSDSFDFTVNDGQGNTLAGQSFALTITAVDDNAPTQSNNTGSTIAEGGTDTLINSELLYTDSEQPATAVAYTVTSVPANGQLELTTGPGVAVTSFTQDDINNSRLVYVHDGSNTTSDSFDFTVNDGQGNTLAGQSFALTITAVDDNAPTQSNNTGSTIAEGGTDTLINSELLYTDSEQPATAVAYTVTSVPANGQLELTTGAGVAITSFTQDDINNNRLVYVHDGSNTTSDSFDFTVNDGQGNTLAGQSFALTITAVDDDAPTQSNNTGSTIAEGGTDTLINSELLYTDSEQPATAVAYTVTSVPANGQLELTTGAGVAITSFTQDDINNNRLVYVHDGSNTNADSFDFTVNDGQGNTLTGQSFALTITAVDDDAPTQSNNTGSTIAEDGTDTLINSELLYTDSEQPATAVAYTVTSIPANGQLELTTGPGVAVTSFTQDDINNNRLVYVHDGSNTTADSFNFTVNDGQGNTLTGQSFALTITAVDDNAPTQSNNTGSTIAEGGTDTLINSELLYTDSEQPATAVAYTVTSIPANGQLELTTGPGVAITSFTQDDINNNRLVYVHDGSNTTSDSFDFTVNDGQGNTLAGQSFALTITAVDDNAPTQSNNTGSTIAEGGTDTLINSELLYTDSEQPATAVAYAVTSVPANGQLELTTGPGVAITSFTQDDINNNRLVYVHDGSNTTADSFDFTVNDGQGNTLAGQSFALTITAVDDNAPTQSNNTGSIIAEGGTDTLINSELLYTDSEQPATAVAYTVTSVPANGQLELTTGPGVAITSFTQDDINNSRLVYVHDGSNTTADSFDFTVNDGQGNTLAGQSFALTITAVDDNAPTQSNNTGSTITEGGTDTLISSELLYTDSEQPATTVAYAVTSVPANGQLELTTGPGVAITSFTQDDINNNRLVYVHDGSNTTADSFDFTVNDGQGNTLGAQSFALTITAVDDNAPTQSNNTGSTIAEGGTDTLINSELLYTDSEQPATAVAYTVTSVPANGQLELTTGPGVAITSFTQDDINNNRLVYVHDGSNTTSDSFDFTVNDGQGNTLGAQSFALTITAVDDNAPTQSNNTGSTIAEGGTDTLISSELLYTDSEQPATAVAYTVTSVPANGQLELTTGPGVAVTSFTQDDINNNRLVYVHDGSNTTADSFDFTVNDGQGNTLGAQSFALTITAVDDDTPTQSNNTGSTIAEGGTDTLINSELLYTDSEQPATAVAYTVTSVLANGQLELTTGPGVAITSFTQDDINNNRLVYVHDGSNTTADSFDFTVNDGQGNTLAGQSFALTITAVDDDTPTQSNNTGSTIAEGGTDTLINSELLYTDSEQPATAVAYTVTSVPANGQLELTTGPGVAITSFTQDDINNNRLVYVHDGSNTTADSFNFTVNDGQGNTLTGQSFALTITAVDDDAPTQSNNTGSTIAEGGTDTLINSELLYTDSEQPATSVAYTVTSIPANGQLELTTGPGVAITSFNQDDINNNRLVYVHDGSNTTADSFDFTVNDGQGNALGAQSFALTITAVDDNAPTQSNNTGSTIAEGGTDTLISTELLYTDSEQPATAVAYTVTSIPANGQLELTTGPGVAVTSFTQEDINNNRLVYVHDGSNTTADSFDFTVNDGQGNALGAQSFALTITGVDDDAPTQSNNTGSTIAEGGTDTLISTELLYTDSEQPATGVAYTVISIPANGQLELTTGPGVAITSFNQDDINNNRLVYVHDGSNTTSDSFDFTVNDGQGNTLGAQSFALTITGVDDDAPTQSNNTGSTIAEGGTDTLISTELLYTDSEQPATAVAYTVTSIPANGQLELTTGPGVAVTSFTQDDINNNRLVYVHDGSNTTADSFNFTVNDGQGNTLTGQSFALTITAVDDDAPTQSNNTGSTIAEGGTDTLINSELLYTDSEQPATSVAYTVTSIPANGQLELTTGPSVAITSFNQDDINNNRLVYVHDGSNTTADSFDFTVNDGQGNTLGAQSFALTITGVDDDAPTQSNNTGSTIAEGGTDTLISTELLYTDSEQPATAVAYTVTSIPANGQLELTTGPGVAVTSFTQDDINNNRLVYVHDGSNTTADSFNFTVNDGQGNTLTGQSFALTITAVDDDAPTQATTPAQP